MWRVAGAEHFAQAGLPGQPFKSVATVNFTNSQGQFGSLAKVRICGHGHRRGGQPGLRGVQPCCATRSSATGSRHVSHLDLLPDMPAERVLAEVQHPRGYPLAVEPPEKPAGTLTASRPAILHELLTKADFADNAGANLAASIKALPITSGGHPPDRRGHQQRRRRCACSKRWTHGPDAGVRCRACSAPEKCWIGKRPQGATCCRLALPVADVPDRACSTYCGIKIQRPCSRRAIHTVEARITMAPINVVWLGTSEKTSHPNSDAQTKSRNRKDWVAEMSATRNPRVRQ
jgi:hypothetical protein